MKKITALFLAVLMVFSMVPAMTLVSSAEAVQLDKLGRYETGAETWCSDDCGLPYGAVTQFVMSMSDSDTVKWSDIYDNRNSFTWELKVTDLTGKTKTFNKAPNSYYPGGNWGIMRFFMNETTADIQVDNVYTLELNIYEGGALKYTGTVNDVYWKAGDAKSCKHSPAGESFVHGIVVNGVDMGTEGAVKYTPDVDPYENPIEVTWNTYYGAFEKHTNWGRVLMAGFDKSYLPKGETGKKIAGAARIEFTIGGETMKIDGCAPGNEIFDYGSAVAYRIPLEALPPKGSYKDCKIELIRKSDDKVMYTGTLDITYSGTGEPEDTLTVTGPAEAVQPGDEITVDVTVSTISQIGMNGWRFSLDYDTSALTYAGIEHCPGNAELKTYAFVSENEEQYGYPLTVGCTVDASSLPAGKISGDAVLARITFKVSEDAKTGSYPIKIAEGKSGNKFYLMTADASYDYELTYGDGSVSVGELPPPVIPEAVISPFNPYWENGLLLVNVEKLADSDLIDKAAANGCTVDAVIDGETIENVLKSTYKWSASSILVRMDVGLLNTSAHTVSLVIKQNGEVVYTTNEIKIAASAMAVSYAHYYVEDSDFEAHASYGKNMYLGIPATAGATEALLKGAVVKATIGDVTLDVQVPSVWGTSTVYMRIPCSPFPAAGEYKDVRVEVYSADGTLLFTGNTTLKSGGEDELYPKEAALSRSFGSAASTDWENGLLVLNIGGLWDRADASLAGVTVDVTIDGETTYENALNAIEGGGRTSILVRLNAEEPEAGTHTAQVTIKQGDKVLYTSQPIDVRSDKVVEKPFQMILTPSVEDVNPGERFTVEIKLGDLPKTGVNGWELALVYNTELLEFVKLENPTVDGIQILGGVSKITGNIFGTVPGADGTGVTNLTEDTVIAVVTFEFKGSVEADVTEEITAEVVDLYWADDSENKTTITVDEPAVIPAVVNLKAPVIPETGKITVGNVTGDAGEIVKVPVTITANPGIVSMILHVSYPDGLTLVGVKDTGVLPGALHGMGDADFAHNPYTLFWDNDTGTENIAVTGEVVILSFKIDEDADINADPAVKYDITVSCDAEEYEIIDVALTPVEFEIENGSVTVVCPKIAVGEWMSDADGHYYVDAYGHQFDRADHTGGEATCTEKAVCEICGAEYGEENGGHSLELAPAEEATCKYPGQKECYECLECGKLFLDAEGTIEVTLEEVILPIDPNNHVSTYEDAEKPATCTEPGVTAGVYCNDCENWISGHEVIETIPHDYSEATCAHKAACKVCGEETGDLNPENHESKRDVAQQDPTCTEIGYTAGVYCDACDTWVSGHDEIAVTAHSLTEVAFKAPTTTEDGNLPHYKCENCGALYADEDGETATTAEAVTIPATSATISAGKVTGYRAWTVDVPVTITANPGVAALTLNLAYNTEILTLEKVTILGKDATVISTSPYAITITGDEDYTADGEVAVLTFSVSRSAAAGTECPIAISYDYLGGDSKNAAGELVYFHTEDGMVTVDSRIFGDVNNDGEVNTLDRTILAQYLANWDEIVKEGINLYQADVNMDGKVNSLDRAILARYLANWTDYEELPKID